MGVFRRISLCAPLVLSADEMFRAHKRLSVTRNNFHREIFAVRSPFGGIVGSTVASHTIKFRLLPYAGVSIATKRDCSNKFVYLCSSAVECIHPSITPSMIITRLHRLLTVRSLLPTAVFESVCATSHECHPDILYVA